MSPRELKGCEYLLAAGRSWVENQARDQELLLAWYGLKPNPKPKVRPPYLPARSSLRAIAEQLALVSAGQAVVAKSLGAQNSTYTGLKGKRPARVLLYSGLMWSVLTSYELKAILKIEIGSSTPEPDSISAPFPSIEASLDWTRGWVTKSARDQSLLLSRSKLKRGPIQWSLASLPHSISAVLKIVEILSGRLTQDLNSVARGVPMRAFGGGKTTHDTF